MLQRNRSFLRLALVLFLFQAGMAHSDMLVDDGPLAADGSCLGQALIFSGRGMQCDKAGVSTGFQNCCSNTGKVLQDDTGDSGSPVQAITQLYDAVAQGSAAFDVAVASGMTVTAASTLAASEISDSLGAAGVPIDPVALGFAVVDYFGQSCDRESTETGMLNGSGFCYEVGEYCREEWEFVGCVQESKSYCCFNSKMARVIHQQGRSQLEGMPGFGTPENPTCRGFTPTEFQSLDFSKIDLAEYYGDLVPDTNIEIETKIDEGINNFINNAQ